MTDRKQSIDHKENVRTNGDLLARPGRETKMSVPHDFWRLNSIG